MVPKRRRTRACNRGIGLRRGCVFVDEHLVELGKQDRDISRRGNPDDIAIHVVVAIDDSVTEVD